jgi:DNA-binding PadR family transcriptional regulator
MKGDHLGEFEELVLLVVRRLGEDAYGLAIRDCLDRETSRDVSIGAVYAALDRLEGKGLVTSAMTEGTAVRGGRSRRSFTLTRDGERQLRAIQQVRDRLWRVAPVRR